MESETKFITGIKIDWTVSKKVINQYNKGMYREYSREKLNWHKDNYQFNKPKGDRLDTQNIRIDNVSNGIYGSRSVRCYEDPVTFSKNCILRLKKDGVTNEKELLENFIIYMANRNNDDYLNLGRVRGQMTPVTDSIIIQTIYGNKCVMCGKENEKDLTTHHINEISHTNDRDIGNQIAVCRKCHCKIHGLEMV